MTELSTSLLEKFIMAENKADVLKDITPHSNLYRFVEAIIALNDPSTNPALLAKQAAAIQHSKADVQQKNIIRLKHLLNQLSAARAAPAEFKTLVQELNKEYLHFSFDFSNPFQSEFRTDLQQTATDKPANELSDAQLKELSLETALERAYQTGDLSHLKPEAYEYVDLGRLNLVTNFDQVCQVLDQTKRVNSIKKLVPVLEELMKTQRGVEYVRNSLWPRLTLENKEALLVDKSPLAHSLDLWLDVVRYKFKADELDQDVLTPEQTIKRLEEIVEFSKKVPAKFAAVRRSANLQLLKAKVKQGTADKKTLVEYLKDPLASNPGILKHVYNNQLQNQRNQDKEEGAQGLSCDGDLENATVKEALSQIFRTAKDFKDFEEYLDGSFLAKLFYEQKLLLGEEVPQAKEYLSEGELEKLFAKRQLKFSENNKKRFGKGEKVEVKLLVKNVAVLAIRVFEVSTLNYILENKDQQYEKIDTAGLIPSSEIQKRFTQSPMTVHEETLAFGNIEAAERGVFIIDFIGEEIKSRCVVLKGQLSLVYDRLGGRSAVILDQDGHVCKGGRTGVYVENIFFEASAETGEVKLPDSVASRDWSVVAVHQGFADLCKLTVADANPSLSMNVLYNSETFQAGNQVSFVIEPKLKMFGQTACPSQLKNVKVTVTTPNDQGVSNSTVFPDLKVVKGEDLVVDLIFPPKVRAITIELKADLGEKDKQQSFSVSKHLQLEGNNQDRVQSLYIQRHQSGAIRVFVLGRNGEPRKNQVVSVSVNMKYLNEYNQFSLVSDETGAVNLGVLKGYDYIEATSGSSRAELRASNDEVEPAYPESLVVKEGETVTLPFNAEFDSVALVEVSAGVILREFAPSDLKRSSGQLTLPALTEGTYELEINKQKVKIGVFKGEYLEGKKLLKTKDGILALPSEQQSWFQSKREKDDQWEVKLWSKKPDLKIRLLTFNYLPSELGTLLKDAKGFQRGESRDLCEALMYPARQRENVYGEQIFLGDELVYVYNRKNKKSFIGNTLEKPGVILKRNRLGETTETEQEARGGEAERFKASKCGPMGNLIGMAQQCMDYMPEIAICPPMVQAIQVRDFLAHPGKLVTGLKAKDGVLNVPKSLTAEYPYSYLSVSDGHFSTLIPLENDLRKVESKDNSLQKSRREGYIYSYGREVKFAAADTATVIPKVENTQLFMIPSLRDFRDALVGLAPHLSDRAKEWDFLVSWESLKPMEKLKKYDKYASHELNLFVFCKDPEFFEGVVRPFLRNKREKEVVDYFLLGEVAGVADKMNLAASQSLPFLERILLAALGKGRWPDFGKALLNYGRSYNAVNKLSTDEKKRRFETLMNVNSEGHAKFEAEVVVSGNPMDGEGYGGGGGMELGSAPNMAFMSNIAPMAYGAPPGIVRATYQEAARPRMLRGGMKKAYRAKKEQVREEKEMAYDEDDYQGEEAEEESEEESSRQQDIFTPTQGTVEYNERQYWEKPENATPCDFFIDLLEHLLTQTNHHGFASTQFLNGIDSLAELVAALAFTDLPFEKAKITSSVKGSVLTLSSAQNFFLLTKEVIEKKGDRADMEVQVSQKIFDPSDPVIYDDEDPEVFYDKPVDEFLAGRPYASRVVVTNSTTAQAKLTLILEIPEGAIPLDEADVLRIRELVIPQFHSEVVEYRFYFPKTGSFDLFPATAVKGDKIVASAKKIGPIEVRAEKSTRGLKTISDVLANGNIDDIVEFMKTKNLLNSRVFEFHQVYWLLKNRTFYDKVVALCEEKGVYDEGVWSFSILHGDYQRFKELLANRAAAGGVLEELSYHDGDVYRADRFRVREYYPLINPRAHLLGAATTNIVNDTFKRTYNEFLLYLFLKFTPNLDDYVLLIDYLIAQDQIEKALELSRRLEGREAQVTNGIQLEYQQAYLSFITGYPDFSKAKAICEKNLTYPVLSWRNLFVEMANQLAEFEESDVLYKTGLKQEGEALNKEKGKKAASFSASLEGSQVKLITSQVPRVTLRFYKVELEVVFSAQPFNFESKKEFTFVAPFYETTIATSDQGDLAVTHFEIPSAISGENLFVEVRAADDKLQKSDYLTYLPFKLNCFVTKEFGILKCFEPATNKPVPRVYVKCFAKYNDGSVKFYKDGYTDLRGSFDYVSLNTDKIDNIKSFAILVTSPDHGSKVIVENPPVKIGAVEGQAKNLISDEWAKRRQQNVHMQQKSKMANQYQMLF
jgi:hypothetical protein